MNVLITGGTGFVGSYLTDRMLDLGWNVTITGRSKSVYEGRKGFDHLICDTAEEGPWQDHVSRADVIVNLAGKNIFTPWKDDVKKEIRESRIKTTRNLVSALDSGSNAVFLSTSAAGFYGSRGDEVLTEASPMGQGFLAELCRDWEKEAREAETRGARVVCMRFSMILGKNGGALEKMLLPFKMCLGGKLGSGEQWMSWMHLEDLAAAVLFLIGNDAAEGPLNFCSPLPLKNKDFTRALGTALGRPAFFQVPSFVLKTVMGELGDVVLGSQRMKADGLEKLGFGFTYPEIKSALENIVS